LLESSTTGEPTQQATGYFYRYLSTPASGKCYVSEELGACRFWKCDDYVADGLLDTEPIPAGTVSVTGTSTALTLEAGDPGSYSWDKTLHVPLWAGGERLTVSVGGSDAFPALAASVIAPDPILIKAPVVPAEPWKVDASADLVVSWTGAENSDVFVAISVAMANPQGGANVLWPGIDCGFVGTTGASLVPASALAKLPKPEGFVGHQLEVLTFAADSVRVDDALLTFQATSFALSSLATFE
jgi:hypothetical protein